MIFRFDKLLGKKGRKNNINRSTGPKSLVQESKDTSFVLLKHLLVPIGVKEEGFSGSSVPKRKPHRLAYT